MTDRKKVKIIPRSQRARNRVHEHGDVMIVIWEKDDLICCESLAKTCNHGTETWLGQFTRKEADWRTDV